MDHSPYSANLALHLFGPLKKHLVGEQNAADSAKIQDVIS